MFHSFEGVGAMFSIFHGGGGHVLQTLFPKPSDEGDVAPTVFALLLVSGVKAAHGISWEFKQSCARSCVVVVVRVHRWMHEHARTYKENPGTSNTPKKRNLFWLRRGLK